MSDQYDVVIIGAGPGGYVAGIRAGQLGLRTAVVEKGDVGGVCLNWGCIPTKALLKNAELVNLLKNDARTFGIEFDNMEAKWEPAVKRSRQVVRRLVKGVEFLLKKNNVDLVRGEARLMSANTVEVSPEGRVLEANNIVIATGSRARLLPGMQADGERIITSRHAVQLSDVPRRLLIMGAGAVGMEFGYLYNAYGSQVTIIEMLPRVLPLEDPECSGLVAKSFRKSGIEIHTGTRVEGFNVTDDGVQLIAVSEGKGEVRFEGDQLLVAIGRAPNTETLGLENAGVETEKGFVKTNSIGQTNVQSVFAIGDVAGPPMLAHKAMHEGVAVVEHLAGLDAHVVDASYIPNCVYCLPQVASIGMTEEAAREAGYEVDVGKFPFQAIGKALAINDREGFIKLVVDRQYGEILGAHIVGPEATEIIHEIALARAAELTPGEIIATIHAHPTLHEAVHEAALAAVGSPIHA
ncbi:MAG: dihydrolipoyl dehydrogenase [Chloroflexi bacterium]|nr:MAG: dihydrolipoyl dehydrogenase [Chloroflexota bacterium]